MTSTSTDGLGSSPPQPTGSDTGSTSEQARAQAQQVAGAAKQEAGRVVDEARQQVRGLVDEATSQVTEQSAQQKDRLASTVRGFAEDLQQIRSGDQPAGLAASVVDQVQQGAHQLAERLEGREPAELIDDVRRFARRRPGTFLLGALAAGVVVGRLVRGQRDAADTAPSGATTTGRDVTDTGVTTVGTPGAPPAASTGPSTRVAPVPAAGDADAPAFPSGRGDDDATEEALEGARHDDGSDPASQAGPSWTGGEEPPVSPPAARPGTGGAPL